MNNIYPDELGLGVQRDVITSCDYETCPTIKSKNGISTMIVVKYDGNSQSIETGNHGDDNPNKSPENRAVRGAHR